MAKISLNNNHKIILLINLLFLLHIFLPKFCNAHHDLKNSVVEAIQKISPASKSGLISGDILLSIRNKKIHSRSDYHAIIKNFAAGDTIHLTIWRDGKKLKTSISTREFPIELAGDLAYRLMGISVKDLSYSNRRNFGTDRQEGFIITSIDKKSYLAGIGVMPGDIIRQIDELTISDNEDFKKAIVKYRKKESIVILLQRNDHGYYITVKLL